MKHAKKNLWARCEAQHDTPHKKHIKERTYGVNGCGVISVKRAISIAVDATA